VVGDATTISLETQMIETVQEAQEYGFKGSPTILVDGTDPFDDGTGQVGLACRLYMTESGLRGHPSRAQLEALLRR